jgi:hypothetical protein
MVTLVAGFVGALTIAFLAGFTAADFAAVLDLAADFTGLRRAEAREGIGWLTC